MYGEMRGEKKSRQKEEKFNGGKEGVIGEAFRRTEDSCMRKAHETSKMNCVRADRLTSTLEHSFCGVQCNCEFDWRRK
jgi:hypothetical protein